MLQQVEGSRAVAQAVAACRPQVVCAYPISPQTHVVEEIARLVRTGELPGCRYVNVESEFAALSGVLGASAVGARTYTATASQGLLFMAEVLYNVAGLGLPVVMTVANRAIGAPINIWNDQSDSLSQRDSGWVQLYAASNQDAVDLHVQAFRLAEAVSLPVMVCMDGFVLTHATEAVDVPDRAVVDGFLPPFSPRQRLDPDDPVTIGAMVGPEAFTEVRALAHRSMAEALDALEVVGADYAHRVGRAGVRPVVPYRCEDAEVVVVALGSAVGTLLDVVDAARARGVPAGVLGITCYRPFPVAAVRAALAGVGTVVVLERAWPAGSGGVVSGDVREALWGSDVRLRTVVAGLGGRPVTSSSLAGLLDEALAGRLGGTTVLDLDEDLLTRATGRTS